ncbi:MFS transporter [Acinetobacter radioresistens]|uniref:MFS transporter n=1 Tax=Acinetobacter radioresistens TaxID=40216 RepID=UPI000DAD94D8|nr:MFS transporter [Acinetobacter radioresistens]AWV86611.1 MFS transporter [Acinetobacter radioresistens]MCX0328614.1 MFS transporter [Acinetobacter radioresistens]HCK62828.1 MFS transporter [Acinetobacter radioresistens]
MLQNTMHRQVFILASSQSLFQTVSVMVMTIGGLAGANIANTPTLATLPIASMFLGTAMMMFPASMWMAKVGRRNGFLCGAFLGISGGIIAAVGIIYSSLSLLALGTFCVGAYQSFAQFYRFAASEVADDAFRSRAISFVMAGGVVAALIGPVLARFGGPLFNHLEYVGSFLIITIVSLIAMGILSRLHIPDQVEIKTSFSAGRPWPKIVFQPMYLVALLGAITGYGIMILGMTATPIAMHHAHHELGTITTVIQLHVLGMFLPSFFTGNLIVRFGVLKVMFAGLLLFACYIAFALSGLQFYSFAISLVLLGVGWNFLFIGSTSLLTRTYTHEEKAKAQAINDMTVFVVGLICSFSAGALLDIIGWKVMNMALIPWLVITALSLVWLSKKTQND